MDLKHLLKAYNLTNCQRRLFNALTLEPTAHPYAFSYMERHHLTRGRVASSIRRLQSKGLITKEGGLWHIKNQELQTCWARVLEGESPDAAEMRFIGSCSIPDEVKKRSIEVFGDEEKAHHWLYSPNYALGDVRPIDLLHSREGVQQVLDILGRIEHGVFI